MSEIECASAYMVRGDRGRYLYWKATIWAYIFGDGAWPAELAWADAGSYCVPALWDMEHEARRAARYHFRSDSSAYTVRHYFTDLAE